MISNGQTWPYMLSNIGMLSNMAMELGNIEINKYPPFRPVIPAQIIRTLVQYGTIKPITRITKLMYIWTLRVGIGIANPTILTLKKPRN